MAETRVKDLVRLACLGDVPAMVQEVFDDLKNTQDCGRLGVQSRATMEGKLFVMFLSSILVCKVRQRMKRNWKGKAHWTMDGLRRSLDRIMVFTVKTSHSRTSKKLLSMIYAIQRSYLEVLVSLKRRRKLRTGG